MQESARAALSYARANLDKLGIDKTVLENSDIHIHVPAGAIPKDGPSAGIAMATALISSSVAPAFLACAVCARMQYSHFMPAAAARLIS